MKRSRTAPVSQDPRVVADDMRGEWPGRDDIRAAARTRPSCRASPNPLPTRGMAAVTGGIGPVGEVGAVVEVGAVGAVVLLIGLLDARVTLGCRGNVAIANVTNRLV
ncbi:hypothetical protein GCM10010317_093330 [Streptomyces mirabilis]|nr:hypothetical protein GCM10010317_093330 [Streptomyces mirabilis]